MKKRLLLLLLFPLFVSVHAQQLSPRQLYPGLFEEVQLGRVYADNKTFVDALPKESPEAIMQAYAQQKNKAGFQLKAFADTYFLPPTAATTLYRSNVAAGLRAHIDTLWSVLARPADTGGQFSSLVPLPHPYIVPGGRFREVYYWDSYFTMLGLQESGQTTLIRHILNNFTYLIGKYGFVPNGNRTYYLTRSQPPFFSLMVGLLAQSQGDTTMVRYQAPLLREYAYWMAGADSLAVGQANRTVVKMPSGQVLNRYWDASDQPREESYAEDVTAARESKQPAAVFYRNVRAAAASGWDFSTRWFDESGQLASIQTINLVPVDLNCLLYNLEKTLARTYELQGNTEEARRYQQKAAGRKKAIQAYCWDKKAGWFMDYNWVLGQRSAIRTLAGVYPLTFNLATPKQARQVAAGLQKDFLKPGGLLTTLNASGQQWDAPNAWAPLQYMAIRGLENYRQRELAGTVASRWVALNSNVFRQTGKLLEKYNVVNTTLEAGGGEYPLQDGFGWTNGVLLKLMNDYKLADKEAVRKPK
ncbi:Alpha,alpha-trehalase [Hymenobacter roseosalivarius DSM 11622]|uniref:Alpha,alpha-trehalase n=1 Tax=Hymenobacter roseosalivarius DSM 11622 TaxID=645990 RepID=A0A1W1VKF7_9BACT|nr:alpha,alpha-trehalase TreF [Hymenobacter roseosalivarius]SMB93865.1 Alpha,alpha-trehalase [Hymenobacter roseosalivarius DSM 11622]